MVVISVHFHITREEMRNVKKSRRRTIGVIIGVEEEQGRTMGHVHVVDHFPQRPAFSEFDSLTLDPKDIYTPLEPPEKSLVPLEHFRRARRDFR
jgi:hypothetical protein